MIGTLWTTGITVKYGYGGSDKHGWTADINWYDDGFCSENTVEGIIKTRYFVEDISRAIDLVLEVLKKFSIPFTKERGGDEPFLFYKGDGEDENWPPPKGWEKLLKKEAEKRGWKTYK